jgi:hypothetical protein
MKNYKITGSNHDSSNSTVTIIRNEKEVEWSMDLMRQCGYQTVTKTEI